MKGAKEDPAATCAGRPPERRHGAPGGYGRL